MRKEFNRENEPAGERRKKEIVTLPVSELIHPFAAAASCHPFLVAFMDKDNFTYSIPQLSPQVQMGHILLGSKRDQIGGI